MIFKILYHQLYRNCEHTAIPNSSLPEVFSIFDMFLTSLTLHKVGQKYKGFGNLPIPLYFWPTLFYVRRVEKLSEIENTSGTLVLHIYKEINKSGAKS